MGIMGFVRICEPLSKLLVSPLITPIVVPYIIPYITPFKEFRQWLMWGSGKLKISGLGFGVVPVFRLWAQP